MKKLALLFICFLFLQANAQEALKGGVVEEFVPKGFYGSWGVISKLQSSNNPTLFNFESRNIWALSGVGNKLILESLENNAHSEIIVKDAHTDGKTLTFERKKTVKQNGNKVIYKETVRFILNGNKFSGTEDYSVETYDSTGSLISNNHAKYSVSGVRISGTN